MFLFSTYFSYRIHVCYIYLHCYMYRQNQTNLGKYTICCPMNPSWGCFRLEKAAETEGFKMTLLKLGWARNGPKPSWGVLEIDGYVKLPGCNRVNKLVGFRKHQQKVLIIVFFLHLKPPIWFHSCQFLLDVSRRLKWGAPERPRSGF